MVDIAQFAPPEQKPENFLGWSKPIHEPGYDQSGEIIGKTIGQAIHGAAEVGSDLLAQESYERTTKVNEEDTSALEYIQNRNLGVEQPEPDEVQAQRIKDTLASSKATGAISNTYHYGMLLKSQKEMRSQFPFAIKAIDRGFREGNNPTANEHYNSLMRDINSFLTAKDKDMEKSRTETYTKMGEVDKDGITAAQALEYSRSGVTPWGEKWDVNRNDRWNHDVQAKATRQDHIIKDANTNEAIAKDARERSFPYAQQMAIDVVNEFNSAFAKKLGIDNPDKIMDAINSAKTPTEARQLAEAYSSNIEAMRAEMDKRLKTQKRNRDGSLMIDPDTGLPYKSMSQIIGPEKHQQAINNALEVVNQNKKYIEDGNVGILAHWNNQEKAIDEAMRDDVARSDIGNIHRLARIFKDTPEFEKEFVKDQLKGNLVGPGGALLPRVKSVLDALKVKSYYDSPETLSKADPGAKFTSLISDVKLVADKFGKSPAGMKDLVDNISKTVNKESSASDSMKVANIRYAMRGMDSLVDRSTFSRIWNRDGRPAALRNIFATPVIEEVKAIDKRRGTNVFDEMKSNAQVMIKDMIGPELVDLSRIQDIGGEQPPYLIRYTSNKASEGGVHRFDVESTPAGGAGAVIGIPGVRGASEVSARKMVERINTGISILSDVARADGSNPDEFILRSLKELGYDPGNRRATTFPEEMANKVKAVYGPEHHEYRKSLEDIYNSFGTTFKEETPKKGTEPPEKPIHELKDALGKPIRRRSGMAIPGGGASPTVPKYNTQMMHTGPYPGINSPSNVP